MLKIRYQRTGRKNDPAYRIVVTEHTSGPQAGNSIATVGSYHPKTKQTVVDGDAIKSWLAKGAQASGTVHNLLVSQGIIEGIKINVLSKKTYIIKEEEPKEEVKKEEVKEEAAPVAEAAEAETPVEEAPAEEEKKEEAPAEEVSTEVTEEAPKE